MVVGLKYRIFARFAKNVVESEGDVENVVNSCRFDEGFLISSVAYWVASGLASFYALQ